MKRNMCQPKPSKEIAVVDYEIFCVIILLSLSLSLSLTHTHTHTHIHTHTYTYTYTNLVRSTYYRYFPARVGSAAHLISFMPDPTLESSFRLPTCRVISV
jgi:hypothetical protein